MKDFIVFYNIYHFRLKYNTPIKILVFAVVLMSIGLGGCDKKIGVPDNKIQVNLLRKYQLAVKKVDVNYQKIDNASNVVDKDTNVEEFYKTFSFARSMKERKVDSVEFTKQLTHFIKTTNLPKIDSNLTDYELSILKIYLKNLTQQNFYSLTKEFENIVLTDKKITQKERDNIFSILFYVKYSLYFAEELDTKDAFNDCMSEYMNNIFNDVQY